ncbi:uncharacterized protein VTP21DRAFT_1988 [Calcarisporiella thermophila]|uniref:uncharacterized protein n=1 Tax=Calcarisporiella thermophila TaxID=911321 RepID=UPI00374254E6
MDNHIPYAQYALPSSQPQPFKPYLNARIPPPSLELSALQRDLELLLDKSNARAKALEADLLHLDWTTPISWLRRRKPNPEQEHRSTAFSARPKKSDENRLSTPTPSRNISPPLQKPTLQQNESQLKDKATNQKNQSNILKKRKINESGANSPYPLTSAPHVSSTVSSPAVMSGGGAEEFVDFSKAKHQAVITNQQFWTYVEPYFKPFGEEDRAFLRQTNEDGTPFLIPKLGKFYLDAWAEEQRMLVPSDKDSPNIKTDSLVTRRNKRLPRGDDPASHLNDEILTINDVVSCGPLMERILSSLIQEAVVDAQDILQQKQSDDEKEDEGIGAEEFEKSRVPPRNDIVDMEERIKRELQFIGLLGDEEIDWNAREDDEVSAKLRELQRQLKNQIKANEYRKQKVLEKVEQHMGYQQYLAILDEVNHQVEQVYLKRFRTPQKAKKQRGKNPAPPPNPAAAAATSSEIKHVLERRRRLINGLGKVFSFEKFQLPSESIYGDDEPKVEDEIGGVFGSTSNNQSRLAGSQGENVGRP